jgi:hypothetical protein
MRRNFKKISRLLLEDEVMSPQVNMDMQPPAPAKTTMDMSMDMGANEVPQIGPGGMDSDLPAEVAQMTISDFMEKCNSLNPLICIGLKSFIMDNPTLFGSETSDQDLDFETAISDTESEPASDDEFKDVEFKVEPQQTGDQGLGNIEFTSEEPQKMSY